MIARQDSMISQLKQIKEAIIRNSNQSKKTEPSENKTHKTDEVSINSSKNEPDTDECFSCKKQFPLHQLQIIRARLYCIECR